MSDVKRDEIPEPVAAWFGFWRRVFRAFESERIEDHDEGRYSADWQFTIRVEPDELDGGFTAWIVEIPGCASEGATEQEAFDNLNEALQGVIAARLDAAPVIYDETDHDTKVATRRVAIGQ